VVLVHGGGAAISAWHERLGIDVRWVDGLRVTTGEAVEVTAMVLSGWVNKRVVAALLSAGRPGRFFDARFWDANASLAVTLPPMLLAEIGEDEARRRIRKEVDRQVAKARADIKAKGWRVLGAIAARHVGPFDRARTWETFGVIHPTFATGPGRVTERIEAAKEVVAFRESYRACWRRYRAGERDIVWPYGTYLMRARHGMSVADPP